MSKLAVRLYRTGFAVLGLVAVITEIVALSASHIFMAANFFSYFTIQSNLLAVTALLLAGLHRHTAIGDRFKAAATLYMVMTGIIFALLLAPLDNAVLTAVPWDNLVLHYIMPLAIVLDWLVIQRRVHLSFHQSMLWLAYPAAYVAYSLIRGSLTGWYPYPFLNAHANGYGRVLMTIAILLVFVLLAAQAVRLSAGRLQPSNGRP